MSTSVSVKVKAFRRAAVMTQSQLAGALGVAQSLVSQCEAGKTSPADLLIRLGNLAAKQRRNDDAVWFWKEAGISVGDMGVVSTELSAQRIKQMKDEPAAGDFIRVPVLRDISYVGTPGIAPLDAIDGAVLVASASVPNPKFTSAIVPTEKFDLSVLAGDDVIVVDASETDVENLSGKMVAVYEPKDQEEWPAGIYVGWLHVLDIGGRRISFLGAVRKREDIQAIAGLDVKLPRFKGSNRWEVGSGFLAALQGGLMITVDPQDGSRVLGRVIYWIASEPVEQDRKELKSRGQSAKANQPQKTAEKKSRKGKKS